MFSKSIYPEMVTVSNGFIASLSLLLIVSGNIELGVRLIFLCMALDVIDGFLARYLNVASEKGEFLDRVFDRLYQVVAPSLLYCSISDWSLGSIVYASIMITTGFWRLARRVPNREYFAGLPLFTHTLLITSFYISGTLFPYYIMITLAVASIIPIKYYRRNPKYSPVENKGTYWFIRLIIPLILSLSPFNPLKPLFLVIEYTVLVYAVVGWIPFLRGSGSFLGKLIHRCKTPLYK